MDQQKIKNQMQKLFLILCMAMGLGLNACQCNDKPTVPPIQETSAPAPNTTAANPNI